MNNDCKIPAAWLAQLRRRQIDLGLTQRDLDARGDLPDGYAAKVLAGMKAPTARTLQRLCRALDLEIQFHPRSQIAALEGVDGVGDASEVISTNVENTNGTSKLRDPRS